MIVAMGRLLKLEYAALQIAHYMNTGWATGQRRILIQNRKAKKMQKIKITLNGEKSKDYTGCDNCIYSNLPEAACVVMKCVHAFYWLNECYKPKGAKDGTES